MNIQEIDKWLDNEYGCSYTRLEELHDFVVEQDLKHREEKDQEIERLNKALEEQRHFYLEKIQQKENIIKEVRKYIANSFITGDEIFRTEILEILDKGKE